MSACECVVCAEQGQKSFLIVKSFFCAWRLRTVQRRIMSIDKFTCTRIYTHTHTQAHTHDRVLTGHRPLSLNAYITWYVYGERERRLCETRNTYHPHSLHRAFVGRIVRCRRVWGVVGFRVSAYLPQSLHRALVSGIIWGPFRPSYWIR